MMGLFVLLKLYMMPQFCSKKSLCIYVDYMRFNKVTVKNKYLVSLIQDLIDRLCRASIFTT
jgi:hypothetical protein